MKIGIVTTWFERGAAYVSKQFKEKWEKEHDVYIYARGGEKLAKNDSNWNQGNITYGKRFKYTTLDLIDLRHFELWIKENNLDVVFFNEQHIWNPILLCHKLGVKTGAYIDYYTKETTPFFEIYDFLICNTKRHFSVFNWHPQAFYVPWGTNTNIYNESQRKKTTDELVFFHSAGMNPYRKGTDLVLEAFYRLRSKKSKLIIHTQTDLTDFFPNLKKKITSLKTNSKLEIINKTVTSPGLYHKGDIYVYPSRLEGIGLTIAEANTCGMPVITTNEAPMNEFIIDEFNGKLINVECQEQRKDGYYWSESTADINHLESLMNYYIENINNLDTFKDNAYSFAQENLSWIKNSDALLKIIKNVQKIKNNEKHLVYQKIKEYEKSRSLRFYITTSVPYQKFKRYINTILTKI